MSLNSASLTDHEHNNNLHNVHGQFNACPGKMSDGRFATDFTPKQEKINILKSKFGTSSNRQHAFVQNLQNASPEDQQNNFKDFKCAVVPDGRIIVDKTITVQNNNLNQSYESAFGPLI